MIQFDIPRAKAEQRLADRTSRWLNTSVGRIHYRCRGEGPTLVLIHNSGMWGGVWDDWVAALGQDYRVLVPDLPGFGLTGATREADYSYRALAAFLGEFIERTCEAPVHIVGLSLGGQLALRCALVNAAPIRSLVLINPTGYPEKALPPLFKFARGPFGALLPYLGSRAMIEKNLAGLWGTGCPPSNAFIERLMVSQRCEGNRRAFLAFLRTTNDSIHEQIPTIRLPVQLQWSDRCGPERFSTDLPDVSTVRFAHYGHLPILEAPGDSAEAAARFIRAIERGQTNV